MIFFAIKLLLQPDIVFDSDSNDCNFSCPAPPGSDKKIFSIFLQNDVTSRRGRFFPFFGSDEKISKGGDILSHEIFIPKIENFYS